MEKGLSKLICSTALAFTLNGCTTSSQNYPNRNLEEKPRIQTESRAYEPIIYLGCFIYLLTL